VLDFDKNQLEVYEGFNKEPVPEGERFAHLPKDKEYYPVKLAKVYDLDSLPSNEDFCKELDKEGDEI